MTSTTHPFVGRRRPTVPAVSPPGALTSWSVPYARRIAVTDALAITTAVAVAYGLEFPLRSSMAVSGEYSPSYLAVSVALCAAWFTLLTVGRTRDRRLLGSGTEELSRVCVVTWHLFAGVAIVGFLARMDLGRGFLGIAAPLGLVLLLASRLAWRRSLHRRRDAGLDVSPVLVVGPQHKVTTLVDEFHRNPRAGYRVTGVCLSDAPASAPDVVGGVRVLGTHEQAAAIARHERVAAVAVAGADAMTADAVRRLGWDLEGTGIDLALTLALTDVAGPRVLMRPVNGLPLMYVDEPRFSGSRYAAKSLFDWCTALALLVLLAPLMLTIAALVKLTSPGPVLYAQERIGKDGERFRMLKFRTMRVGAHDELAAVLAANGVDGVGAFYKLKDDPRVTRVGRVLRRLSLDELPQLVNVLRGDMSLVGPRPQIEAEVATYDRVAHRRLLVRPGMTGLWQVSGRSSLDPRTAMRLDVAYVENWTLAGDVLILARTARAVLAREGAY
ncbi:sugar transferase [Cellulomonas palmilytica]|uniref:sugar transferase n=1 Tax=Cellulomonas palmilytica TaxID=2608402 RepID=UPI001F2C78FB|nr:sugar transferase [Cellulomonas palmilytica]UJP41003.1 sugar transferase [Cellulomonas palmilytica]